jgi:hypothetical protein
MQRIISYKIFEKTSPRRLVWGYDYEFELSCGHSVLRGCKYADRPSDDKHAQRPRSIDEVLKPTNTRCRCDKGCSGG